LRRLLLFLPFLLLTLWAATADELKIRIMESLARLVTHKENPGVYIDTGKRFDTKAAALSKMRIVSSCETADVLFTENVGALMERCRIRPGQLVFSLSYRDYLAHKERTIGAFFWQKGRPNIILNGEELEKERIEIPKRYEKYVE